MPNRFGGIGESNLEAGYICPACLTSAVTQLFGMLNVICGLLVGKYETPD